MFTPDEEFGDDYFMNQAEKRIKKLDKRVGDLEGELKRVKEALNEPKRDGCGYIACLDPKCNDRHEVPTEEK